MLAAALALVLADTPEAALKEFVAAWNRGDAVAAAKLVDGTDPKAKHEKIAQFLKEKDAPRIVVTRIRRSGDKLIADVDVKMAGEGQSLSVKDDTITIVQRADGWKLVASQATGGEKAVLSAMTSVVKSDGTAVGGAKSASQKTVALSNMKQIALGTLMYAGDWNDILKMSPATAKEKIMPYIKNREVFKDPATGKDDVYVFNNRLTNVPFDYVKYPAETVLWSLGAQGALLYPYDGKTVIAFADGHVKLVGKADIAKLRWTPDR